MNSTEYWTANPSRIDLPVYGRAFGMPAGAHADSTPCGTVRGIAGVRVKSAFITLTQGAFPGTSAWRPPIC